MSFFLHYVCLHSEFIYAGKFPPVSNMQEALTLVMRHHIKSEIIGEWLYCFTSPLIGFQLEAADFWRTIKHGAWVYSCSEKQDTVGDETLNEIRARLGSRRLYPEVSK